MALTINFDTPQSGSSRVIVVTGTVAANTTGYLFIDLDVTNAVTPTRDRSFYRVVVYDNSASSTPLAVSATYAMAIVPKVFGSDTVSVSGAWSYV
ncbi:hypothetical protein ACPWSR_08390 [Alloiococcus sp. CFN-8]|uniref:hypothetical protein n=1 Tax=Alloiococcus sp. CFN-8 TaxID=3416081 RepID=UPI003CF05476